MCKAASETGRFAGTPTQSFLSHTGCTSSLGYEPSRYMQETVVLEELTQKILAESFMPH